MNLPIQEKEFASCEHLELNCTSWFNKSIPTN